MQLGEQMERADHPGVPLRVAVPLARVLAEHVVERLAPAPAQLDALEVGQEGAVEGEPGPHPRAERDRELESLAARARERGDVRVVRDPRVDLERRGQAALQLEATPGVPQRLGPLGARPARALEVRAAHDHAVGHRAREAEREPVGTGQAHDEPRDLLDEPLGRHRPGGPQLHPLADELALASTMPALSDVAPTSMHAVNGLAGSGPRLMPRQARRVARGPAARSSAGSGPRPRPRPRSQRSARAACAAPLSPRASRAARRGSGAARTRSRDGVRVAVEMQVRRVVERRGVPVGPSEQQEAEAAGLDRLVSDVEVARGAPGPSAARVT